MGEGDGIESRTASARALPQLRTVLVCDLVDSTALIERLGDRRGSDCIRRHDRLARELLQRHGGREIDKTDGFLALFDRPVQAVAFALDYQRSLHDPDAAGESLRARVGIHVGEVMVWENSRSEVAGGAKAVEVEGLAKPVAARLMSLARPGQILLSGVAQNLAQRAQGDLGEVAAQVRWLTHGRYRFKGVPAPMLVHEVGEVGVAPLTAPCSSTKVQRELPWWRSPGALALEAALMLLTLGSVLYIASRPQPAIAFGERDWVVVGDLRNLTADGELSEALETAFRISLEQSRYVNVLSDLKVRDTLARMQREAEGIIVDREVGSEIALREGARALILPTVADVGGRVRVSAEVVDPSTQTTVYAESADGVGIASTLGSIDTVTHHLRHRLGEALAAIDQDSMPLPQVTTDDVQALKWFAQAEESFRSGRYAEAGERYRRAVAIDPGFAMAHMGLARTFVSADDLQTASLHMAAAASDRDRLPAREQLYIDAWLASLGNIDGALQKWKLLMQMYPDMPAGHYNYALFAYQWAGRYEEAQEVVIGAADARYPLQGAARYLQGTIALARDRMDEAMEAFSESSKLGVRNHGWNAAWAVASTRDFEAAQRRLDEGTATGIAAGDALGVHSEVTFALDRGDLDGALVRAESFVADASAPDLARDTLALTAMMLRVLGQDSTAWASSASAYCRGEHERRNQVPPTGHAALAFRLATCGYVLAGTRFADEAPALVDSAVSLNRSLGYSTIEDVIAMATAERLRLAGQPEDAVRVLTDRIDGGELYGVHVVLLEALADAGESEAAVEQADWLAGHRGRAYGEWNSQHALQAWNVAHSNLAWLRAAELEAGRGRPAQALDHFEEFLRIWPESGHSEPIGARVRAVRERLQPSSL